MSNPTDNELWSIALPSGEIRKGSLDQLDDAFNAGLVNEDSLVLAPGATEWTRLGDLAGIDGAQPAPVVASPPTLRPVMTDLSELVEAPRAKSRAPLIAGIVGGVAALGAVIAIAVMGGGGDATKAAAAAAAPPKPSVTVTAQKPAAPIADDVLPQKPVLSEAQKKALQEADEARAKLMKAKKGERDTTGPYKPSKGISDSAGFGSPGKSGGKCTCRAGDPLCSCM